MFFILLFIISLIILAFALSYDNEVLLYTFIILIIICFIFGFNIHGLVYSFLSSYDWSTFFDPLPLEVS